MSKKGVSAEEKRAKLRDYLLSTCRIVSNKDLEGPVSRATGISGMIIKDVMKELLDNDLVDSDKIGAGTFYWCFPSKDSQIITAKLEAKEKELAEIQEQERELEKKIQEAQIGREDTEERRNLLSEQVALLREVEELDKKLAFASAHSPEAVSALRKGIDTAVEGANRWTDNTFALQTYLVRKMNMDSKMVKGLLQITDNFDYIE